MIGMTPRQTGEHPAARLRATPLPRLRAGGRIGHFVRDHFGAPRVDPDLRLVVDGAVERPAELDRAALDAYPRCERTVVIECAGHRRAEYDPPRRGVQWEAGAVGEARWGGARLADVLAGCGPAGDAVEVVLHGADGFARSLPIAKARDPETLLVWTLDGEPLPEEHGAPLRAIVPGWYGTDAVKWLTRIEVVTEPFTGRWQAEEYRWIEPGEDGLGRRMGPMPVHALVTEHDRDAIAGVAWSDGTPIARVDVRVDGGPWRPAELEPPADRWAFTRWRLAWSPAPGAHRVEARATDAEGRTQPDAPPPNVRGFGNHSVHRVDVVV